MVLFSGELDISKINLKNVFFRIGINHYLLSEVILVFRNFELMKNKVEIIS